MDWPVLSGLLAALTPNLHCLLVCHCWPRVRIPTTHQAPATGSIPVSPVSLVCWELGVASCPPAATLPHQLKLIKPAHLPPIWSSTSPPSSGIKGRLVRPLVARVSICCSGACQSGFLGFSLLKWIFSVNFGSVLFVSSILPQPSGYPPSATAALFLSLYKTFQTFF